MDKCDVKGEKSLITAILNNAISDALLFRNPKPAGKSDAEKFSYSARLFIKKENPLLRFYCNLIGLDPDYFCEKAHAYLNRHDFGVAS